jgi:hypothetical protein
LDAIFSTAEQLERSTWQWQVLRLPRGLRTDAILEKTAWDNASFQGAGIVRKSDANRKRIPPLQVVWAIKTILGRSGRLRERFQKIASHCTTPKPV